MGGLVHDRLRSDPVPEGAEMQSAAATVEAYLRELSPDRRSAIEQVRDVILASLPEGYEEGMQYGMIGYFVPLPRYPDTYNGQPLGYVGLGNQKRYMSLYLNSVYADRESTFREEYAKTGKRLDMGKSCVRFRSVDDLPLDLIGRTVAATPVEDFIRAYERSRGR
jgi:hypothetical protein